MATPSRHPVPLPSVQSFLICQRIVEDTRTGDFVLIAPLTEVYTPTFPAPIRISVYAHFTGGHGAYRVALQVRDGADRSIWEWLCPDPFTVDPLGNHRLALNDAVVEFPEPGRYDLLLMADGQELSRHALHAHIVSRPAKGTES